MINTSKSTFKAIVVAAAFLTGFSAFGGNPDRAGSSGGMQLLVNPWARSNALSGANMASASPVEAMHLNVAGMAFVNKTEVSATHINYLSGSDVAINSAGIAQRIGETSVIGLAVSAYNFGDIRRTTVETPDGDGTFFNVNLVNIGLSYAKAFSNSIYGGITVKVITEGVADLRATGVAFDAGINYVTGDRDQLRFGISLRNVGPPMSFSGDGLSFEATAPARDHALAAEFRSANYELPSLVNIGASYDFLLNEEMYITAHGAFVANSFTEDNFLVGVEYSFKDLVFLRAGHFFENNIFDDNLRRTAYTGLSFGAGVDLDLGKAGSRISFDYAYRATNPFGGIHALGVRLHVGTKQ